MTDRANKTNNIKHPIERLRETRWWKPTVRRYAAHLNAIKRLECLDLREPFVVFAAEVMNAPEAVRDEMLEMKRPELAPQPKTRYRQYDPPAKEEI